MAVDVTVSSIGDAKSLEGGVLLLAPFHGPDGQVYAEAQGPLTLGGYSAGGAGNTKQVNHPQWDGTQRWNSRKRYCDYLIRLTTVPSVLRDADFTSAREVSNVINRQFGKTIRRGRQPPDQRQHRQLRKTLVPDLISGIQNLSISVHPPAKVVINERTGTIVMGGDVKLSSVSVLHGTLSVEVTTSFSVSQPAPLSKGG